MQAWVSAPCWWLQLQANHGNGSPRCANPPPQNSKNISPLDDSLKTTCKTFIESFEIVQRQLQVSFKTQI